VTDDLCKKCALEQHGSSDQFGHQCGIPDQPKSPCLSLTRLPDKGKKIAPKAGVARRRPAAAAAAKPAEPAEPVQPVQPDQPEQQQETSAPTSEPAHSANPSDTVAGAAQPETSSTQPEVRAPAAPLPTPPATQQSATQPTRQPTPPPPASLPHHVEPSPLSLAQSEASHRQTIPSSSPQPPRASTPPVTQTESRQFDPPTTHTSPPSHQQSPNHGPSSPNQLAGQKRKRPTPPPATPSEDPTIQQSPSIVANQQAPSTSEADSEVALINTLVGHQEQPRAPVAPVAQMLPPANAPATVPKPRAKRQKKTATTTELPAETDDSSQAVSGAQDTDSNPTPAAKPKKPRASRAKRAPKSAATVVEDENGNVIETEEPAPRPAPKPRKPRQKKKQPQQVEGEDGGTGQDDPSDDPANHEIDVTETTMFELTKDRGLGKVSERETKMAAIDWDEVHRKRVAEAEAIRAGIDPATLNSSIQPTENQEGGEGGEGENTEETPRPAPVVTGPRLRIDAEGNLVVDEDSLRIDRQAQAERNAENLIVTENDDLTKRVNQMSWINERRRDPTDRVPFFKMKSDPWSDEETDRFYEALRMFGTDFFIISKMFQPKTRRQIKLKFIREERLDPDRVNRVLAGEAVAMDLGSFAEATGQDLEGFKDPRELEEELRVEGEEQRVEIARKKKEMEEAKEQRDIQMAAREKDQEERAAQRREKAAMRQNKRRGIIGSGTF
jgi:transcription factor TFIIIB component B''